MGQIIGSAAKPKRCNINKLSQLGTPAAGEYILVSSDNSMNAAGQGNFDCYIEGDGQKAATALELKKIAGGSVSRHNTQGVSGGEVYSYLEPLYDALSDFDGDTLYICDKDGNVVAKLNENGLFAISASIKNSDGVLTDLKTWLDSKANLDDITENENINNGKPSSFYICDKSGYAICRISSEGLRVTSIHTNEIKDLEGNTLISNKGYEGYELFTLCDSLGSNGVWQQKVASILGCTFDQEKNIKAGAMLSVGGTTSFGTGFDCMPWRAKNLIDQGYINNAGDKAIIVLENVNDGARAFDNSARSFNLSSPIEGYSYDDFGSTMLNSIPSSERKFDACLRLTKTGLGKNLSITSVPTREGDILLRVGWSGPGISNYYIHVVPQSTEAATRQYVLEKILEYNYTGVTDVLSENGTSVDFSNGSDAAHRVTVEFTDTGNTGMTVSITDTENAKTSVAKYFIGDSLSDWSDTSKWQEGLTYSEGWKTTIEMLAREYPQAHIIVAMFPSLSFTAADYLLPNGTYDTKAFYDSARVAAMRTMRTNLGAISEFYSVPFADVFRDCGITISNYLEYYYTTANVHPMTQGYLRFGETIAAQIRNFV